MNRFGRMNKGVFRLLLVLSVPIVLYCQFAGIMIAFFHYTNNDMEIGLLMLGSVGGFIIFWTLVRAWLWIFDGFVDSRPVGKQ